MNDKITDPLRSTLSEDRQRLDTALATLTRAVVPRGLGERMASSPWIWLLAASVAGALLGLRKKHQEEGSWKSMLKKLKVL